MSQALRFLLVLLLVPLTALPAAAVMGEWAAGYNVEVRLIATGMPDGPPKAALEIRLAPGWKTYWRTPGEGGLPPTLDFGGSLNLGAAEVRYPTPRVLRDGNSTSNVYSGRVVLPLAITQAVPGVSTVLDLKLRLGVCETVCIPVDLATRIVIAPALVDPQVQSMIEVAEAQIPGPAIPGVREIVSVTRTESLDTRPEFLVRVRVPNPDDAVLLAEGPAGWYPLATWEAMRTGNEVTFVVTFDRLRSGTRVRGAGLVFTIVSGGAASEQTWALP